MFARNTLRKGFIGKFLCNRTATRKMSTNAEPELVKAVDGGIGICTLNRPKALNSLNLNMCKLMLPLYKQFNEDPNIHAVILEGTGRAFCAGGDVISISKAGQSGDLDPAFTFFKTEYILDLEIANLKKPNVSLLDGITMGGGVGLSVHGSYRIATENTLFAMPETKIGLFPDVGGGYFLPRLKGELGMYLALTGGRLKGEDVYYAGIATHFVPSSSMNGLKKELAKEKNTKALLDSFHAIVKAEPFSLSEHIDTINDCFAGDCLETMISKLKKAGPWGQKQAAILSKMSPLSLKITIKQLRLGANMTLHDVLKMELGIAMECMRNKDFYEGIRSVLIDKCNTPTWTPGTPEEVTEEMVDAYFKNEFENEDLSYL